MNQKSCKRFIALMLAAVLTVSGIQVPSASVRATELTETSSLTGEISGDNNDILTYGDRSALDEMIIEEPLEIISGDDFNFLNSMGVLNMSMLVRFDDYTANQDYALFAMESEDKNTYFTVYYNPGLGRIGFKKSDSDGYFTEASAWKLSGPGYHKITFVLTDTTTCVLQIDNQTALSKPWTGKFASIISLVGDSLSAKSAWIGRRCSLDTSSVDLAGDIKYVQFSKSTSRTDNNDVDDGLKNAFGEYLSSYDSLQSDDYTGGSWDAFSTVLANAKAVSESPTEWAIHNAYVSLEEAKESLVPIGNNHGPVSISDVSRTLIKGRTLKVYGRDLATDEDNDALKIKELKNYTGNLTASINDGVLEIRLADNQSISDTEKLQCVVTDGRADVETSFTVDVEEELLLELDLENVEFDPAHSGEPYIVDLKDARKVSQLEGALNISLTFKYDASKSTGQNIKYLFDIVDSEDDLPDNAGQNYAPNPANSSLSFYTNVGDGRMILNTGAWVGSSNWDVLPNANINDGNYHTMTVSITAAGASFVLDGRSTQSSGAGTDRYTKAFVEAFFGTTTADKYKDWRSRIDKIVIGDSSHVDTLYGKFGGEIKNFTISDGTIDVQDFHKSSGIKKPLQELETLFNSVNEDGWDAAIWSEYTDTEAYQTADSLLKGTTQTYAADIYNNVIPDLQSAIQDLSNFGLTDLGEDIRDDSVGMFNNGADNTWLFGGGVETQGRFEELEGKRSYIYQFEEYVRWLNASGSNDVNKRQRYMVSVGKEGADAVQFEGKLDSYIAELNPKAVSYLIGPEDYTKGQSGVDAFKAALKSIIEKSLAVRNNTGFAVIQLPHALKTDAPNNANVSLYSETAKAVLREVVAADSERKSRIVVVDHFNLTDSANFKNSCLTEDGFLNGDGHYEMAKEFAAETYGSTDGFQAQRTNWTLEEMPETFLDVRPTVTAAANGVLNVTIPSNDTTKDINGWNYTLEIGGMEIDGTASGSTFAIDELEEGAAYSLLVRSGDGKVQLAKAYGTVTAGQSGGAEALTGIAQKIRQKADGSEPLTWLFMGDSITHGALHTYDHDSITQTFEKYLKEDLKRTDDIVINTAVSSATTVDTMANIAQRLEQYQPDIVSVMLGTNDSANANITVEQYKTNLNAILAKIREVNSDALIILRSPTPTSNSNYKTPLENSYLEACKEVADADGDVLYIDQYTDWDEELDTFSYLYVANFYYNDSLHPNVAGHLRMTQQFISECGLDTDTRIPNLSYRLPYAEESCETITPVPEYGQTRVALNIAEMARLEEEYGESMGAFEVILTDKENNRTYTHWAYTSDGRFIMDHLPNTGNRTYTVQVIGTLAQSAKRVSFKETEVTLSQDSSAIAFAVLLDNHTISDISAGSTVGTLSVGLAAPDPDGDYIYTFVDDNEYKENALFTIEGNTLKIKSDLTGRTSYTICIQATSADDSTITSRKEVITLKTISTLQSIREQAQNSFLTDQMALDLDLSDVSFSNGSYLDLADENGDWYAGGAYLEVLNNLREHSTGGTIIFRFKTTQQNAQGLIFGSGSATTYDKNIMSFGLDGGNLRGLFRASGTGTRGTLSSAGALNNNQWHTVAFSFDTTKADYRNEIIASVDGGDNIISSSWYTAANRSWFSINPADAITHFAIGGGVCTGLTGTGANNPFSVFTGNISFLTITDTPYTIEELKTITETPLISGRQNLSIVGNQVVVPDGANYTSSDLAWSEENSVAEFTLTAEDGALFNAAGNNPFSVSITSDLELEETDLLVYPNGKTARVTISTAAWRTDSVLEAGEFTFKDGVTADKGAQVDSAIVEKLAGMRRGSITVRYKLSEKAAASNSNIDLFSVSGAEGSEASFYVRPSTGTIGYEVRNQQSVVNSDAAALTDIQNTDWHTITYVFKAEGTKIYLDSVLVLENNAAGFFKSVKDVASAQIGSSALDGEINELLVTYDTLGEEDVETLHAATTGDKVDLPSTAVKTDEMNLFSLTGEGDFSDFRLPSLLTTSNGTTIAAADKRQTTNASMGNIDTIVRTSEDNGQTWSDSKTVFNQPSGTAMDSFTMAPSLVEDQNGRIHMIANMFPESEGTLSASLLENGSGFKEVNGKMYPVIRNYPNTMFSAEGQYTQEYTIREDGVVYEENADGTSTKTFYVVPDLVAAAGGGDLYWVESDQSAPRYCGNIYVYTGPSAGELKAPRVMSLVSCYSDDDGATWQGYQNITGMVKEDWVKYLNVTPGVGICLENQTDTNLNGRLMVPVYHANDQGINSYSATVIYSDDNGASWQIAACPLSELEGIKEETETFREKALREAQIVEMNDGTVHLFCSNYSGSIKICDGTVTAEGVNWSKISDTPVPDVGNQLSVIHAPKEIDGKDAVIVSKPAGPETSNGYIRVALYENGTFDWKYLYKVKSGSFGNSCLSVLDNANIGLLYKADANLVFTSMSTDYITAPRYEAFGTPEITNATMTKIGKTLSITVTFDSGMMKKGEPVLMIKVNGETEAVAQYQSGNASKEYVFTYEIGDTEEVRSITVVNVGVMTSDTDSFIEGVTGEMPANVNILLEITSDMFIAQIQGMLDEYKAVFEGEGAKAYTNATWNRFYDAYVAAKKAIEDNEQDIDTLEAISDELAEAYEKLDPLAEEIVKLIGDLEQALEDYKEVYEGTGEDYESDLWTRFRTAYEEAQKAIDESEQDEQTLQNVLDELIEAYRALEGIELDPVEALIKDLQDKLEEYKELFEGSGEGYDAAAWLKFQNAYQAVQQALADNEQDAEELKRLLGELNAAKEALDGTSGDPVVDTELENLKATLNALLNQYKAAYTTNKANYTDASWKVFSDAYLELQNALNSGTATKETLIALQTKLQNAYKGLIEKKTTPVQLAAPTISSVKFAVEKKKLGVKITVQKVANAASYTVYRMVGSKVTQIGDTNASGVVYDENPVNKKTMSYYAVANAGSESYQTSAKGAVKSIKLAASTKKITAKQVKKKTQVKVSWKKVKNAKQYILFRSTKKNSGYVKVKALKKLTYTDKKVKKGKTYYYRVVVKTKKGYTGITTSKAVKIKK